MKQKILLSLLGVLMAFPVFARDFEYTYEGQTLTYTVIDEDAKTCMTKEGDGKNYNPGNNISGDLILPENPKDGDVKYILTKIPSLSFFGCDISSVVIPESVTSIGAFSFLGCSGLKSVIIPGSVTSIGDNAFTDCKSLDKATFASVEALCNIDFVNDAANPLFYAQHLYINGEEVTDLVIPESVTTIGNYAFNACTNLKSVVIGNSVQTIGWQAFSWCRSLT